MAVISRDDDTDAADEERWIRYGSAPLIATLVLPIVIGVILLLKCVFHHCCVRKTTTKDEMYGLEGRVTMLPTADSHFIPLSSTSTTTTPTNRPVSPVLIASEITSSAAVIVNSKKDAHGGSSESSTSKSIAGAAGDLTDCSPTLYDDGGGGVRLVGNNSERAEYRRSSASHLTSSQDSSDLAGSLKRASAQHRQLPDLPQIPSHPGAQNVPRRSSSVLSHDGTSELYATVGETPLPEASSGDRTSKRSSHYAQIRDGKNAAGNASSGPQGSGFMNGAPGTSSSAAVPGGSGKGRGAGIEATPSSDSETYASSHHPYAKLKKNTEHPYARVRSTAAGGNGNDEETDTDNYDLPQFVSRHGAPPPPPSQPSSSSTSRNSTANPSNNVGSSADAEGPVPPRRIGRQWRRSSQPQVLNNDNAAHFSGDSQDSRGYTSISVREPLSNLRSQVSTTRSYDSHYATVSDDSEEMYAAIDDPNDANYMRIPGEEGNHPRRPTWLERREANSPLPPVPNVPPPELSPGPSSSAPPPPLAPSSPTSQTGNTIPALPVYAQVTKKTKKGKTPVTPTASNASISSQQLREAGTGSSLGGELSPLPPLPPPTGPPQGVQTLTPKETSATAATTTTHSSLHHSHHHLPHRSKRAASLMDNTNPMDADTVDSRRWSKADISYSEFDVVRENLFPTAEHLSPSSSKSRDTPQDSPSSRPGPPPTTLSPVDLVDEDNYNIIPEKRAGGNRRSANKTPSESNSSRHRLDSGNYHEIEPPLNNTYQEIGGGKEPSDHYQEIGDRSHLADGNGLYQEIDKKGRKFDDDDEEEDDGDQFYERVKPSSSSGGQKGGSSKALSKKHGYEKIKRKGNLSSVIPAVGSDEEDEDDDDDKPDELYESVKYPPYERLKESKDDLAGSHDDEGRNGSDYYEDIGYTRVKAKNKAKAEKEAAAGSQAREETEDGDLSVRSDQVDVSQLYARVDKSKKRKGASSTPNQDNHHPTPADISGNNNEPPMLLASSTTSFKSSAERYPPTNNCEQLYSKVTKSNKSNRNSEIKSSGASGGGGVSGGVSGRGNDTRLDNDNSIEYI